MAKVFFDCVKTWLVRLFPLRCPLAKEQQQSSAQTFLERLAQYCTYRLTPVPDHLPQRTPHLVHIVVLLGLFL
jgi:hypothetical protein